MALEAIPSPGGRIPGARLLQLRNVKDPQSEAAPSFGTCARLSPGTCRVAPGQGAEFHLWYVQIRWGGEFSRLIEIGERYQSAPSIEVTVPRKVPHILLVDNDPETLKNLSAWLSEQGFQVKTARHVQEAVQEITFFPADLVITEINLPDLSGIHLLMLLKEFDDSLQVIGLSSSGSKEDILRFFRNKGFDCIFKPIPNMLDFKLQIERALLMRAKADGSNKTPDFPEGMHHPPEIATLTSRERAMFNLLLAGLDNTAIADRLCITEKSVRNALTNVYRKLGTTSRTQTILKFRK